MLSLLENKKIDEYWLSYLRSHLHAGNRMCHYLGTVFGIVGALLFTFYINIFAGIIVGITGYSIALIGHYFFEKNHPHASKPHWSLMCDFLMLCLFVSNKNMLEEELQRATQ